MRESNIKKVENQLALIMEEGSGLYAALKPDGTAFAKRKDKTLPAACFMAFVEQELYVFAGGKMMTTSKAWSKAIAFSFSKTRLLVSATIGGVAAYELITEQVPASSGFQFAAAFVVSGMGVFVMVNSAFSGELVYYIQKDWDRFDAALDLFRQSMPAFSPEKAQALERFLEELEQKKEVTGNGKEE